MAALAIGHTIRPCLLGSDSPRKWRAGWCTNDPRVLLNVRQPRASAILTAGNTAGARPMGGDGQAQGGSAESSRGDYITWNKQNCSPLSS